MSQIFPIIKEKSKDEVQLASLLFDNDPLLTKRCRKLLTKKGGEKRILTTTSKDGLLIAEKDIVLPDQTEPIE